MTTEELIAVLKNEKDGLFKAVEFIISFYTQIYNSIVTIRDNLFPGAFSSDQEWKKGLNRENNVLVFPEHKLISSEGEIQTNSETIIVVLNNINAIQHHYLKTPENLNFDDLHLIKNANTYLLDFIRKLFNTMNPAATADQRRKLAKTIRSSIIQAFENSISPFFEKMESLFSDEYKITIRPELKKIAGTKDNYSLAPVKYDLLIKERFGVLSLPLYPDIVSNVISDLDKSEEMVIRETGAKYLSVESRQRDNRIHKLKEIANRSVSQTGNLTKLEAFLDHVYEMFQPLTFFQRIMNYFRKMFTGKGISFAKKDISFFYSLRTGKIEKRSTSIKLLLKDIAALKGYFFKMKNTLDFHTYTKTTNQASLREIDNTIENGISALNMIHTQCLGLRDWLIWDKNLRWLKRIPGERQEEFNQVLIAINYHLIITRQSLKELMRGKTESDEKKQGLDSISDRK